MKLGRIKNKGFTPITFTIETENELKVLWHRLNVCSWDIKEYSKIELLKEVDGIKSSMWDVVNDALDVNGTKI